MPGFFVEKRRAMMRVDKFLKNSRIIKRRTVAKDACNQARVFLNDKQAKAGDEVSVGDKMTIKFGNEDMEIEVLELIENVRKSDAEKMYKRI